MENPADCKVLVLPCTDDFDPDKIFSCGQCFRWNRCTDGSYTGVALGRAVRLEKAGDRLYLYGVVQADAALWRSYFDLDRSYAAIRRQLGIDGYMRACTEYGAGIRILRQDSWEALCTFIISQCNNIPRITRIVETLCALCGAEVRLEGRAYRTFPSPEAVASLSLEALAPLRCGYRAPYILNAARTISEGRLDLSALSAGSTQQALEALCALDGVGLKVASCAALFGLQKLDVFPVDVWMKKALRAHYPAGLDPLVFGGYAGIAQQYMFYYQRLNGR